jgi:hypothetical protein
MMNGYEEHCWLMDSGWSWVFGLILLVAIFWVLKRNKNPKH